MIPDGVLYALLRIALCALGAFMLHLVTRSRGRAPLSLFQVLNIDVGKGTGHPVVILLDMVISSILGGIVVYAMTQPTTVPQSVVAGLGMSGLLSATGKDR